MHLCPGTNGEDIKCLIDYTERPSVYGPCESALCGGVCEFWDYCKCWCHTKYPQTWEPAR